MGKLSMLKKIKNAVFRRKVKKIDRKRKELKERLDYAMSQSNKE